MRTDPARLEMMRSYFNAIAAGMGHVIERTSFTTFVKESADFAAALATPDGEFYVYPKTVGVTIFLGLSLKRAIEESGPFEPGDIVITNDPYSTDGLATHLPDIHVFKPIFIDGEIVSYAWSFVHCSDVGGMVPASISPTAVDIHQEGLRIPPVKIYKAGKENLEILKVLRANSRAPELNEGDINAMIAAVNTAEIRLKAMAGKFGTEEIRRGMEDLLEQASIRAERVFARIPEGTYSFSDYLDDDMISDVPIRLAVSAKVSGGNITLDFSDCDPQVQTAFNLVTNGSKHSFLYQGLIHYIISEDPFIPVNGGLTRPIAIIAPKGTLINPEYPASVGIRHSITMRLYNVVLGALAKALAKDIPAAGAGQSAIVVLSVPDESGGGRKTSVVEPMGGGGGGQHNMDGADGIDHASGFLKNTPIESLEQHIDIHVLRYELIKDTAGSGLYRGGHAIGLDFETTASESIVTARGMERLRFQPWGLAGGTAGAPGRVRLHPDGPSEKIIPKIDVLHLTQGDVISIHSPGGGGWGDPFQRNPKLILKEVESGLLSEEAAFRQYGVAFVKNGGRLVVDQEKTSIMRKNRAGELTHWDFGKEREAYERRWTEEASSALARLLRTLPAHQRSSVKHLVHHYFSKEDHEPISKQAVTDVFTKWAGEK
ncbi:MULTISPECIES: hydantoinase B/oxoprolinase family protein [unclassified Bacillus (in: firmicutes)]|uniref:hydantoinase B/oxoprolinase family protein n=1 Tax=unclassified Bacillus (in: firmicutes) TaxID=185979 RepID=UPI00041F07AB|nr:hydantoinase B/oxoprolinase family protein [Bacillus sp. NSP9.1]QHZ48666.1 hydantoinase B/oxoprolinase family protein [Bacillus sp. NSP9.1]